MKNFGSCLTMFLLVVMFFAFANPSFSQNKPVKQIQNATFDASVLSNPNVVDSYIDESGKQLVIIKVPGVLPGKYKMPVAHPTDASVMLSNVPAYDWSFGCSATAAAMMAGYYDNNGYPEMYTGPANGGVAPMNNSIWGHATINGEDRALCPLSATRQGLDGRPIKGHVDDYWINAGNNSPDPYIGNWTQHEYGDCTGDFMKTNQSEFGNSDGSTIYVFYVGGSPFTGTDGSDGNYGLRLFFESRGAIVLGYYNQYIYGHEGNTQGFTFENYKEQIDAGRPVILQLAGHSVLGLGYDDASQTAYVHNTWDYGLSELSWGGTYSDMQHYGVSVMELFPLANPILTIDPVLTEVGWQAGSTNFSVVSNKTWLVSENADWLTVSPDEGTGNGNFTAAFTENPFIQPRSSQITVTVPQNKTGNLSGGFPESFVPLIWEDFSDNVIPAGWQVQESGQVNWFIHNEASAGAPPPCLRFNWEPSFVGVSRMATNIINTTGITSMSLMFKHAIGVYSNSFTIGVAASKDGGSSWQDVWSIPVSANISPETVFVPISDEYTGLEQFRLCFFFIGDTWDLWDWNIDNVLLMEIKYSETVTLTQQGRPVSSHEISLNEGWTGISSYLIPENTDIITLLEPLDENMVIIKNLEKVYWPGGNINTLVNWDPNSGYVIKTTHATTLSITGLPVENKVVALNPGWNLIPALCTSGILVSELFTPILSKLVIIKEIPGTSIFWPAENILTLTTLQPGKSYLVKVNAACEINFENAE